MRHTEEHYRLRACLWIVNTLQRYGSLSLRELNQKWLETELSGGIKFLPRTFFNYKAAIQDLFGIIIECYKPTNSYRISCSDDNATTDWLLQSFSVSQLLQENKDIMDRILLENIPSGQQHLGIITEALRKSQQIAVQYQSFKEEKPHIVVLEPYCAKLFHQRWYIVANNTEKGHLQTYSLDRMLKIELLNETFVTDASFNPKEYFKDSFGIFVSEQKVCKVLIKVDASQRKYLLSLPLHHSQKEVSKNEKFSIFQYKLVPTEDFVYEIQSHGALYEVLEPASLRDELRKSALKLAEMYK